MEGSSDAAPVDEEIVRIEAARAKDPTDYMILRDTDRPRRVGVFGNYDVLGICAASGDRQAIRTASEEWGPGAYVAVAVFHWRALETVTKTVEQLAFVE